MKTLPTPPRAARALRLAPLAAFALGACAPVDDLDGASSRQAEPLVGRSTANATCSDAQRALLTDALRYGRAASNTTLFNQCVTNAVLGPGAVSLGGFSIGPYVRCRGDQNYDQSRAVQASRALQAARSLNHVEYGCDSAVGIGATGDFYTWDHALPERFAFNGPLLNGVIASLPNPVCSRDAAGNMVPAGCRWAPHPWPYTAYANTFWHEAIHTHGYGHGINRIEDDPAGAGRSACGVPDGTAFHFQQNTMPYIIGQCVEAVIAASQAACGSAQGSAACRPDQMRMLTSPLGATPVCGCVDDPRLQRVGPGVLRAYPMRTVVFATSSTTGAIQRYDVATRAWTNVGGPGRMFAVNDASLYGVSADGAYVLQYTAGTSWAVIGGASSQIIAGGASLYSVQPGTGDLWRYNGTPWSWTRVGGPGAQFVANRSGLYALSANRANVLRFDGAAWSVIGGAAGQLFAGPTALYATDPARTYITRYDGSAWTRIAYAASGLLSGNGEVVDTGEAVYRRSGAQVFRHAPVPGAPERWESFDRNAAWLYAGPGQLLVDRPSGAGLYRAVAP